MRNLAAVDPTIVGFYGPAALALVLQHMAVTLVALSIVRERSSGAMDRFRASPMRATEVVAGKVLAFAVLGGAKAEFNVAEVMQKRLVLTGSTLRPRPVAFKGAVAKSLREKVWPLIEAGKIKPVIYKTFPLAQASEAHRLMESSQHIGKIVLTLQ